MAYFADVTDVCVPLKVVGKVDTQKFDARFVSNMRQSCRIADFGATNVHFLSFPFVQSEFNGNRPVANVIEFVDDNVAFGCHGNTDCDVISIYEKTGGGRDCVEAAHD